MKLRVALALPAVALTLAACGGSSSSSSSSSSSTPPAASSTAPASSSTASSTSASGGASPAGAVKVDMKNLAFSPDTVKAKVGQTVTWTNADTPPHNVTYMSGPKFTSSSTLNSGQSFSVKLTQPGTIHYFCSIHPFMKATIAVSK